MQNRKKYGRFKKTFIVVLLLMIAFWTYVEIENKNSKDMTVKQKVLKAVYPVWMWFAGKKGIVTDSKFSL